MNQANKAIEIPLDEECGLMINVGRDGVWMHFSSANGGHASININLMTERTFIGKVLTAWCEDRVVQANRIINNTELNASTEKRK